MRRSGVFAVALASTFFWVLPAAAHNGVGAAFKGPAGPYTVYAYDGYPVANGHLAYRLVLLERSTGEPAEDVSVSLNARPQRGGGAVQSPSADVMANVVFYDLANPYPADWLVTVTLRGRLGTGRTSFAMHGAAPYVPAVVPVASSGSGSDIALIAASSAGGAIAVAGVVWWYVRGRRRRTRTTSSESYN